MAEAPPSSQRVLLGFRDAPLGNEYSSWDVSRIGGEPDAPAHVTLLRPSCALCSATLSHVAQVYCPLEGSPYHRILHVFACSKRTCWGKQDSWVVLRSQSLEGPETQSKEPSIQQKDTLFAKDWCEDADDWGGDRDEPQGQTPPPSITSQATSCSAVSQQMDCVSRLEDLSLSDGSRDTGSLDVVFRSYYVAVADEEDCAWNGDLDHVQHLLRDYEKREGLPHEEEESSTGKGEGEKYEKSNLKTPDLVFHKFLKKIAPCTQQILRYSWNGSPLYMSPPAPASPPPPCCVCGGRRVFEFQLMPALVSMLHGAGTGRLPQTVPKEQETLLEFGTVLVFTCERSCWAREDRVSVQEFCFVQEDPDQKYFN